MPSWYLASAGIPINSSNNSSKNYYFYHYYYRKKKIKSFVAKNFVITITVNIQVKQQLEDTEQDYSRLQETPFVTHLGITLGDLKWAADMATSRSFAIPKGLGGTALEVCLLCCRHITNMFCTMLTVVHAIVCGCSVSNVF